MGVGSGVVSGLGLMVGVSRSRGSQYELHRNRIPFIGTRSNGSCFKTNHSNVEF